MRPGKRAVRPVVVPHVTYQPDELDLHPADPRPVDLHSEFLRADLLLAMGQPAAAARILQRVVDAEPSNEAALELLARAYFGSAQLARSEDALTRLVHLAPANGWARRALARTLERQSRGTEAAPHHRMADALGAG